LKKITSVNSTLTKSLTTCAVIKEKKHEFPLLGKLFLLSVPDVHDSCGSLNPLNMVVLNIHGPLASKQALSVI
jgi:hypothetical protein